MAFAPAILAGAAGVFGAIGALQSGENAQKAASYNAALARQQADATLSQTAADADRQRRLGLLTQGRARAGYGASGITVAGSPLDVLAASAAENELDVQTINYRGNLRAAGLRDEAALDEFSGRTARQQSYISATAALLGGAANAYRYWPADKPGSVIPL